MNSRWYLTLFQYRKISTEIDANSKIFCVQTENLFLPGQYSQATEGRFVNVVSNPDSTSFEIQIIFADLENKIKKKNPRHT